MAVKAKSAQYTIRGVPAEVDRVLRQKAARNRISLNQVIVDELTMATVGEQKRADYSDLVGLWTPDPEFDAILAEQRVMDDEDRWR